MHPFNSVESLRQVSNRVINALLIALIAIILPGSTSAQQDAAGVENQPPSEPEQRDSAEPADEPVPVFRFDPIIVTATRTEKTLFNTPATADLVTSQDIAEAMYRTFPEALRDIPGVMVQKTSHGQGSPFIRGFTGFRTLTLIDGIRLNNSVFRDGPNQYANTIDPYSLSRIEVVKGPSSVLYGSDAIGGTINAITKGPSTYDEGMQFGGRAFYRVSSAERSHTIRGELSATWNETLGVYSGATYKQFGDFEAGSGRQPKTGYDEFDGDFKVEYFINPDAWLVVAHQRVDLDNAWRTHKTIFARSFRGTTIGNERRRILDQNRELTYLQFHAQNMGSLIDAAHFSISYHSQSETRDRVRSDGRSDHQGFNVDTLGLSAQFESPSPVGVWTYGAEYYRDRVDSFRRDFNADGTLKAVRIQGPVADDATYDLVGVYAQDDISVTDSLELILGGRFTYARADAGRVQDPETGGAVSITDDYSALVGSARFLYRLDQNEHWNLFGGVSQGFRAPNFSDLTRFDTARTDEIETPAPGLDSERYISYEIGIKSRYENLSTQASYFYTDIEDMIIRQPTGAIVEGANEVTKRNSGSGFVQGVELGASWRVHPNFTAFGSFAWVEGEVDSFPTAAPRKVREPLSRLMPATGQLGLRWDAPEGNVWVEGLLTMADRADRLSSRDKADTQRIPVGGTPGYAVLSLRGGWRVDDNLTLTAAIENLTDTNYRIHGSGVNEPGINFIFGLEYSF